MKWSRRLPSWKDYEMYMKAYIHLLNHRDIIYKEFILSFLLK